MSRKDSRIVRIDKKLDERIRSLQREFAKFGLEITYQEASNILASAVSLKKAIERVLGTSNKD